MERKDYLSIKARMEQVMDFQDNEVYILIVLARKKYNPDFKKSSRAVMREILTKDNYEVKLQKCLALMLNYQGETENLSPEDMNLYLQVNPRNVKKGLRALKIHMAEWEYDNDYSFCYHMNAKWTSCLQKSAARSRKRLFIVDVDTKDESTLQTCYEAIGKSLDAKYDSVDDPVFTVETRNGYHLVAPPFNVQTFYQNINPEWHPSSPTAPKLVEVKTDDCLFLWSGDKQ